MAGVGPVDYSGAHSKTISSTTLYTWPSAGLTIHSCNIPRRDLNTAQHGKKTRCIPLGCRTTTTFTNGSGGRRCHKFVTSRVRGELPDALKNQSGANSRL